LESKWQSYKQSFWVPLALLLGIIVGLFAPVDSSYAGNDFQARVSQLLGWTYFFAWSMSFYPQVFLNMQRKSVVGLSLDYQMLNTVGFLCYFIYNVLLYFSKGVQKEYENRYDGKDSAVELNDVVFAGHAFLITVITLCQIFVYYDYLALDKFGLLLRRCVICSLSLLIAAAVCLAIVIQITGERTTSWLTFITMLSYAKVVISVTKYCPQVWMNYERKSTVGWNIYNVLMDFTGGFLSVTQLLWDSWATNDWRKVSGDPAKLLLGNLSIFFDCIFIVQHYCLYRSSRTGLTKTPEGLLESS
jgi:cystinosin